MFGYGPFEDICRRSVKSKRHHYAQATITVDARNRATFENYHTDQNEYILTLLRDFLADDSLNASCYLWGKHGTGKSHLLYAACRFISSSIYIPLFDLQVQPEILSQLNRFRLICVDDIPSITGQSDWEECLLTLLDSLETGGNLLILTGDRPPVDLDFSLKDLVNRLQSRQALKLSTPSDETKVRILMERADERGLPIDVTVIQYIVNHYERSMHSLIRLLDRIAYSSLEHRRHVTIPFVRAMDEYFN